MRPALCCLLCLALAATACGQAVPAMQVAGGEAQRGRAAVERYGCTACHTMAGLPSYGANVGPPLADMARRAYLAGVVPNTPENMVRWLRDPPQVDPGTRMPKLGLSEQEAADVAAFLYEGG
jgi:cytochrome c